MKVKLLHSTPLYICSTAIRECWDSHDKSDTVDGIIGENDKALIDRIGNKAKHTSVKNHLMVVAIVDDEFLNMIKFNHFFNVTGYIVSYSINAVQNLKIQKIEKLKLVPKEYHYLIED